MKILKFNELNLNIAELDKTVDSVKKGDILVNRIINGEDISFKPKSGNNNIAPVTNPDDIIPKITTRNRYDHDKGKSFFLRNSRNYKDILDTDNGKFKLNDIEKTDYFGSSGGASLGSKDAKIVESIQCIFLALRQSKRERSKGEESGGQRRKQNGEQRKGRTRMKSANLSLDIQVSMA